VIKRMKAAPEPEPEKTVVSASILAGAGRCSGKAVRISRTAWLHVAASKALER
jgi:hypothetical protein